MATKVLVVDPTKPGTVIQTDTLPADSVTVDAQVVTGGYLGAGNSAGVSNLNGDLARLIIVKRVSPVNDITKWRAYATSIYAVT